MQYRHLIEPRLSRAATTSVTPKYRLPIYVFLNVLFVCYVAVASSLGSNEGPHLLYLSLLFSVCSTPILLVKKTNDRFSLYTIFFAIYFVSYGMLDVIALTSAIDSPQVSTGLLTSGEVLILVGGAALAFGYLISAWRGKQPAFGDDWPMSSIVVIGSILWAAGTYATWYWNIRLTVRTGQFDATSGELVTTLLMIGRYAQPLGLLILAYAYTISRSKWLVATMIALAFLQVALGFASDTKGGAMSAGIIVIVTGFLVTGKIPKGWAVAGLLFILFGFPIFQAHRAIVVYERGESNANTAADLLKALHQSLEGQNRAAADHPESFFERSSVKSAVEMIVARTGNDVPFQHGYTLIPLAMAFIPRLVWPDKLDVQTGQLLDKQFHVTGTGEVYISPSHLGEMYWNFGWPGAIIGMTLLGMLLGWINNKCDLSTGSSVTRLLILGITIYQLGVRFEASIGAEYAVWIRSAVGILILHWLFARRRAEREATPPSSSNTANPSEGNMARRFPNLLS
ncbi:MAG: O-antigen polymerase [Steroidobacteraceae bacterium]|jgi:hypothetical protein